jgi:hypothetical protein
VKENGSRQKSTEPLSSSENVSPEGTKVAISANTGGSTRVYLSTAVVMVEDVNGTWVTCKALLDSASQSYNVRSFV